MKKIKLLNSEVNELLAGKNTTFPKYTTQLMNLANQNSQGTRPKVVGQMSDLIQIFDGKALAEWEKWYKDGHPDGIANAAKKITSMIEEFKKAIVNIDEEMIKLWVEELVIIKTFSGLKFQEAILRKVAESLNTTYRLSTTIEESIGIDGLIGNNPVSIKPMTYKVKMGLNENIEVPIIFYDKKKDGIVIEYDL